MRGGEDARGARRGAAWRGRVAGRMRPCRWTILGVCAAYSSLPCSLRGATARELARVGKTGRKKLGGADGKSFGLHLL